MLLTMHKSKLMQKKMDQKADKLHLWWFPSRSECKQGYAHMLATNKQRKMAADDDLEDTATSPPHPSIVSKVLSKAN